MEKISLAIAQSSDEFDFILKNTNKNLTLVPLNLETMLFCQKAKNKYFNPINLFNNELHEIALTESKKLIDNINYDETISEVLKLRHRGIIRKLFNSSFFVYSLINEIKKKFIIEKIYVSGWHKYKFIEAKKNFFVSKICFELFGGQIVKSIKNFDNNDISKKVYEYKLENFKKFPKNSLLVSNLGYNFKRIIYYAFKTKFRICVFSFEKVPFFKKKIFSLLRVNFYYFKAIMTDKNKLKINVPEISYTYNKKNFSNLLNSLNLEIFSELSKLHNQCLSISNFLSKNKPKLILLNMLRGYNRFFAEISKELKIPSVCISHGTVSKSFSVYGSIYQNIIAEDVFSGNATYYALQSKITKSSLSTVKISGQPIETGNVIFSESKQKNKKYILYAVTNRNFVNMQYYGIETFYEYFENLKILNLLAEEHKLNFLVKIHPGIKNCIQDLRLLFKKLNFTNISIDEALKISQVTISYSSTVIEDSLYSKIPVILFDQWKRYIHCDSQKNPSLFNCAVYYTTNKSDLLQAIDTVKKSKNINFDDYIYEGSYKQNIFIKIIPLANVQ